MNDILQERAIQVIKPLIPADAEERVGRSFKQWNQVIREHIRNETGLKLAEGDSRYAIPVKVVEGFPLKLAKLIGGRDDPILWRLIVGQPKLGGIVEGLSFLLPHWPAFEKWPALPANAKDCEAALHWTLEVATALQQASLTKQVRDQIIAIDEDILGVYRFTPQASSVELYWMPIAMVAAMLDVRIEDLTLVVLAHELAHGYTHIGRDIDGTKWDFNGFAKSEVGVIEGLAQFYTQVVTQRIAGRTPGAKTAYDQLLTLQSGPYLVHKEWLKDDTRQRGESVRFAMISARNRGAIKYADWVLLLNETNKALKTRSGAAKADDSFLNG